MQRTRCDRRGRPPAAEAGLAMPLAMAGSLLLLLGSLSVQTASLQLRLRSGAQLAQQRAEDELTSEAHRLVGALAVRHGCLLDLPLAEWDGAAAAVCVRSDELAALRGGPGSGRPHRLIDWRPAPWAPGGASSQTGRAELLLEHAGAEPSTARRAAYAVVLAGEPRQVRDLRELGLRGVSP